jgi:hypothetical protein
VLKPLAIGTIDIFCPKFSRQIPLNYDRVSKRQNHKGYPMDFKAIHVLSRAVSTLMGELKWDTYGSEDLHTPIIASDNDCRNLDVLLDIIGTLSRMMDTRINYLTSEGKVVREWIETILEIGERYKRELEAIQNLEKPAS